MNIEVYRGLVDQSDNTMKSTDLHKFVYEATGKYEELKTFHRLIKDLMDTENSEGTDFAPTLRANNQVQHYNLSEVECNMIMAKIDVKHLRLISEVFVKVKNNTPANYDMSKMLEAIVIQGSQTNQLLSKMIDVQPNTNSELEAEKLRIEIENLKIDKISKIAKLSKDYKLETIGNLTDVDSELTTNLKKLTGSVIKEVRPSVNGISPTEAIKLIDLKITASELYKAMNKANVVDVYEQPKYLGGVTLKWEISDSGRYYGYNQHSSSVKKYPVQVKLYSDRFLELIQLLQTNGYL
jgi:hypothetical protein